MEKFARPGDFCPNPACPDYGKPQGKHQNNLKKFGKTRKGLQRRGHPDAPPPTFSDGWGGIGQAILEVYGVVPEYGGRRRPPTRKKPGRHWQYVQAIRQEDKQGRWMGIRIQVVLGSRREALEVLGRSTAYVERSHLTSRLFNGRQVRQTSAFSKELECTGPQRYGRTPITIWSVLIRVYGFLPWKVLDNAGSPGHRQWRLG